MGIMGQIDILAEQKTQNGNKGGKDGSPSKSLSMMESISISGTSPIVAIFIMEKVEEEGRPVSRSKR